ncbi:hypothetical protein [Alkaliphilus hydrothermalis]|uniref:Uncharacterized protein n=1 Tax=Alkaliphilus hydrothermalis TaxID=1482730 RepID=A0ABS2NNG3_9FIRM|nr:hypothetical protein [Alkaliphilus hydrothermalis]MBM7614449.1 hypothetical protein [Alkaliphilus hydrothermalis]
MKKLFQPFNVESLVVALGLSFISYMIAPVVKEIIDEASRMNEKKYGINEEKATAFRMNKGSLS